MTSSEAENIFIFTETCSSGVLRSHNSTIISSAFVARPNSEVG